MKKILFSLLFIAATMLLPQSCSEDYLDLKPTTSVATSEVFKTTANAWGAINGIHRMLFMQWRNQNEAGHHAMCINMEFLGEDLVSHSGSNTWWFDAGQWTGHRSETSNLSWFAWRVYYRIINNANLIIANIDNAFGPQTDKDIIKAQALAYRAWSYFNLVQLYAARYDWNTIPNTQLGIPLVLTATQEGLPRSTVEEVYTQINLDLTDAFALITGKTVPNKTHISERVIRGFRARVALATGNWPVAATEANAARTGVTLMSAAQLVEGFNNLANPEYIWGSQVIADQTTYFHSFYAQLSYNFSSSNIRTNPKKINSQLYLAMDANDRRRGLWAATSAIHLAAVPPGMGFATAQYASLKFKAVDVGDSRGDFPLMRGAEMLLIEAEANARIGGANEAAARTALGVLLLNRITGYNVATLDALTGQPLIDHILFHRRVELWGEGFRFYDLKRQNIPLARTAAQGHNSSWVLVMDIPAGDPRWVWLIPRDEMDANPALKAQGQNL